MEKLLKYLEIFKINTKSLCKGRFQTCPYLLWQAVQLTPAGFGCGGSPALPTGWQPDWVQFPTNGGCGESIAEGCAGL